LGLKSALWPESFGIFGGGRCHLPPGIFDALLSHQNHVDPVFHPTKLELILGFLTHPKRLSNFMISGIQVICKSKYRIIQVSRSKKSSTFQSFLNVMEIQEQV
jgi:hypothetical protein